MLAVAMEPKDWVALSGVAATVIIAVGSLIHPSLIQRKRQQHDDEVHQAQQKREDELHQAQQKREDELRQIYSQDSPHIEFGVDCRVHGRRDEDQLVEFILTAHNQGLVKWKFRNILLRVLGIERNKSFTYWEKDKPRLEFPVKVLDNVEVKPSNLNFIFVEPGVKQTITYVTKIPNRIEYILARAEFQYDKYTPHSSERVFRLTAHEGDT